MSYSNQKKEKEEHLPLLVQQNLASSNKGLKTFTDNRSSALLQKKQVADIYQSKKITQLKKYQTMATRYLQSGSVTQLVLKDAANAALEAQLIEEYHRAERLGDACAIGSKVPKVHQDAIAYFQEAIDKRIQVNALHVAPDAGHITAIAVLNDKKRQRRVILQHNAAEAANQARQRAALAARNAAPPPAPAAGPPIGTGHLASWITGIPAWTSKK